MAQFLRSFEDDPVGALPGDFLDIPANGSTGIAQASDGTKVAYIDDVDSQNAFIVWDGGPSFLEGEGLAKFRISSEFGVTSQPDFTGLVMSYGPATSQKIAAGLPNRTTLRLNRAVNFLSFATDTIPALEDDTWYYIRFERANNGWDYRIRFWEHGTPEPASWNIDYFTQTNDEQAGYVGGAAWITDSRLEWQFFSVGTDGDPAPTAPVSAVATPTNLGVTNLEATSARLTWEQG